MKGPRGTLRGMLLLDEVPELAQLEQQLLTYVNPGLDPERMSARWPLSRFQDALLIGTGYVVLTVLGALFMKLFVRGEGKANPFERLARAMQPFYNITQVFLCAYMAVCAARRVFALLATRAPLFRAPALRTGFDMCWGGRQPRRWARIPRAPRGRAPCWGLFRRDVVIARAPHRRPAPPRRPTARGTRSFATASTSAART